MTETQQKAKCITLKGSAELVKQYLRKYNLVNCLQCWQQRNFLHSFENLYHFVAEYGVNSILYQRGIYPPEMFQPVEHFGLFIFMSTDEKITSFLDTVLGQIQEWLIQRKVQKIVLVITNVNTKEILEKWDFKVEYEGQKSNGVNSNVKADLPEVGTKDVKTIQKEIREVIRQITGRTRLNRDLKNYGFYNSIFAGLNYEKSTKILFFFKI